ncbi:MAG: ribonuclease P protein component [Chloroflexota bacterium]
MQRRLRLTRSDDFEGARWSGRSYAHRLVVLVARKNETGRARVGVAAGRSVGNAVKRNRAKRLLRAAMHSLVASVPPGWDVVLIARPPLASSNYTEIREVLVTLLRRAELVIAS